MTDPDVLEVSVHIAAPPETVFPYFTGSDRYVQWMGTKAFLDPVPGGAFRVGMRDGVEAAGEFVEVDPPRRLVFTWGWTVNEAVPPGSTRVVVTLEDVERHSHGSGWELYLDRLRTRTTVGDPGPDPNG